MKTFNCKSVTSDMITLTNPTDVKELYNIIKLGTENFILEWQEKGMFKSKVTNKTKLIIVTQVKGAVLNGEIRIGSEI